VEDIGVGVAVFLDAPLAKIRYWRD